MAAEIFHEESDLVADIGKDITREAMDKMGVARLTSGYLEKSITNTPDTSFIRITLSGRHYL